MTDHDGEELHPVHVLPYRIVSNEYGDYAYEKKHDTGELTAATLPELAEKLRALAVDHVLGWAMGFKDSWRHRHYAHDQLVRFNFPTDRYGYDYAQRIAQVPANGLHYVAIGEYRVEMRLEHGGVPALPTGSHGFESVVPAMVEALVEAKTASAQKIEQDKEAARVATEARKRAELARLKAELGET